MKKQIPVALAGIILIISCSAPKQNEEHSSKAANVEGVLRDTATGLIISYSNLKPQGAILEMNQERLGHVDIPIGEVFYIVLSGVSGFALDEGRFSVDCSITITDSSGEIITEVPDLFKGEGKLPAADTALIKIKVTTPDTLHWEARYKVTTVLQDKLGGGSIKSEVVFRAIDMP